MLLHALQQIAVHEGWQLSAMHVHHGLSVHADDWLSFCAAYCHALHVPFYCQQVAVDAQSGQGLEASARAVRYAALAAVQQELGADLLVTAHHVQDQAETLLLQLLRGAGVKGLSAMGVFDAERRLLRPMLHISKSEISEYAHAHALRWVEDDSNSDTRFERNFIRAQVMPVLRDRYPHVDTALSRSANHLADAQQLLDVLALQDLELCGLQEEWLGQSIALQPFYALGEVRGKNLLRGWFQQLQLMMPSCVQLAEYWQQLSAVKPHGYLHLPLQGSNRQHMAYVHHYQGRLYCVSKPAALPDTPLVWQGGDSQRWGEWQLTFKLVKGKGIALARLGISPADITLHLRYGKPFTLSAQTKLLIHARAGGESVQPDAHRPRRELKVIFQMLGIPPWQRAFYPLASVVINDNTPALVGLLPLSIAHAWRPGRNAYGLVVSFSPAK